MTTQVPRRWWNFSLRTLFVLVTLLCCYLAYQRSYIGERQAFLEYLREERSVAVVTAAQWRSGMLPGEIPFDVKPEFVARIPLTRKLLGDEAIQYIRPQYWPGLETADRQRFAQLFPEAKVEEAAVPVPCHPGCFPHGTLVSTPSGPRNIEEIVEGDAVFTVAPAGERKSLAVLSIFRTQNRLWDVETSQGVLRTTETQPFSISLEESLPAGKLQPGAKILRWADDKVQVAEVMAVHCTQQMVPVINLVLGNREPFIANDFLARSKPPELSSIVTTNSTNTNSHSKDQP
ncbi:hypothetical protein ETAA8_59780 [Anatilimnocola aggregata]|uniref:Hint domain-containing protein n=1 Tax=Anatilimnocola aggregata TaxID=2528021 RepID=A0A517YKT5_9BACT|nr:Hint domain-containing protein [Anatilimnocola aggregata]QDU30829.1 hypothetical protein ETAA8_59780 [Anatilimnocola aggregata]